MHKVMWKIAVPKQSKQFLLQFALDSIARIESYIEESSFENWIYEPTTYDATILRLQFLGFSLRDLSKKYRTSKTKNYFANKAREYDTLTRDYRLVDSQKIWKTVTLELPKVKGKLQSLCD